MVRVTAAFVWHPDRVSGVSPEVMLQRGQG